MPGGGTRRGAAFLACAVMIDFYNNVTNIDEILQHLKETKRINFFSKYIRFLFSFVYL